MASAPPRTIPPENIVWQPHPGPQTRFLATSCREVLYGGAAGGGKTDALIAYPLRWVTHPKFHALTLRRKSVNLGEMLERCRAIYPSCGGRERLTPFPTWRFAKVGRAGARIEFRHCESEQNKHDFQGDEIHLLSLDELTHFTESQYREIKSRVRSSDPRLPTLIRATTNPGGEGHEWVFRRWGAWLDPDFEAPGLTPRFDAQGRKLPPARPGEVLWILVNRDGEIYVPRSTPGATTRCFIPARLEDNPSLSHTDYEQELLDNDPVRVAQLRDGDWLAKPAAGKLFQRGWFQFVDALPHDAVRLRSWDRAATEEKLKRGRTTNDPDWTAGCGYAWSPDGRFFIWDLTYLRGKPGDVFNTIANTAELDGLHVPIALEQEPGASGKFEIAAYIKALSAFTVIPVSPSGEKVVRAGPISAQTKAGNVYLVRALWNERLIRSAEAFPDGDHDDDIDAWSQAHLALTTLLPRPRRGSRHVPTA